ncbi:MAG TPA: DUF2202 domain-containing protein [Thermoanaerobaculia bacterium]|nr:DUF2202 domain-containing protein [Thermoanaerobaculia bacterium]
MNRTSLTAFALAATLASSPALAAGPNGGPSDVPCDGLTTYMATLPVEPLSEAEKEGLLFLREEEKLARDVYVALAAKWGHRVFTNIAAAEQQHMDAVLFPLERYALADPAAGKAPGAFADERLAALYVALVEKGSLGLVDAFTVGATIEDLDLAGVEDLLEDADNVDVDTLTQNLAKGSRNHLRSFAALLANAGAAYAPVSLDAAEYQEIVTTPRELRVVYDAAGNPVEGIPAGPCAGTGPEGNAPGTGAGAGPGPGSGPAGGSGTCNGTGPGTGGNGNGGNGNGGKP